jgi:hypothetical protein
MTCICICIGLCQLKTLWNVNKCSNSKHTVAKHVSWLTYAINIALLNKETKNITVYREIQTILFSEVLLALFNASELIMSSMEQP